MVDMSSEVIETDTEHFAELNDKFLSMKIYRFSRHRLGIPYSTVVPKLIFLAFAFLLTFSVWSSTK
jgi:hypothetical protein